MSSTIKFWMFLGSKLQIKKFCKLSKISKSNKSNVQLPCPRLFFTKRTTMYPTMYYVFIFVLFAQKCPPILSCLLDKNQCSKNHLNFGNDLFYKPYCIFKIQIFPSPNFLSWTMNNIQISKRDTLIPVKYQSMKLYVLAQ